jgi:DNA-nicking Smr family endonuclease
MSGDKDKEERSRSELSQSEKDMFKDALKGVKALKREKRAGDRPKKLKALKPDQSKAQQRQIALGESDSAMEQLMSLQPKTYGPNDLLEYKKPGVQEAVYKKLRMGRYPIESRLDLHGLTVDEAMRVTSDFIRRSRLQSKRCLHISHGKGVKQDSPAKLKNYVAVWLANMPEVLAYHSAQPKDGGTGCVYVLLAKSEEKKQENRERFLKEK